jgi:type-F conjugative transfer system pilin assembly protein TrbC
MLCFYLRTIIFIWFAISVAHADTTEEMRDKAVKRFGKEWVTDVESWTTTLQGNMPSIKPFQPQKGSKNLDPGNLVDRFVDVDGKSKENTVVSPEILVFVSTSMADRSLQQWARQVDKVGGSLVLRGFVNNSIKETIKITERIFGQQSVGGFSVDPEKFKDFNIKKVPAVVVDYTPACGTDECPPPKFDVVYGNIGLLNALTFINNKGSALGQKYARGLLNVYQGA